MTNRLFVLVAAGSLAGLTGLKAGAQTGSPPAASQPKAAPPRADAPDSSFQVRLLRFGMMGSATSGYRGRISEYTVFDNGLRPTVELDVRGHASPAIVDVASEYGASDDQRHEVAVQIPAWLAASVSYDRLRHWLDHDPLAYGVEVPGLPPIRKVTKVDLDPHAEYRIVRSVTTASAEVSPPAAPSLRVMAGIRSEGRDGSKQAIAFSMCQNCHLAGRERVVSMRSNDYTAGATLGRSNRYLHYAYAYGDFREQHRPPETYYGGPNWNPDPTLFPSWPAAPQSYTDKLMFSGVTRPYDAVSPTERASHRLQASVPVGHGDVLALTTSHVATRNRTSGALLLSNVGHAAYTVRPSRRTTLSLTYGLQRIDNDDVLGARRAALAPYLTANDPYAPTADQWVNSALTRTVQDLSARAVQRIGRSTSLQLAARWKSIDRDHFDLGATNDASVKVVLTSRALWGLSSRLEYVAGWTDNPFQNPHAGKEDPPDAAFINLPYSRIVSTREALSIDPTERHELRATWSGGGAGPLSYSFGVFWRYRVNTETDWVSHDITPTVDVTYATPAGLAWTTSYSFQRDRTSTMFAAPDMLEKAGALAYHHGSFVRSVPYDEDAHVLSTSLAWPMGPRLMASTSASVTRAQADFDTGDLIGYSDFAGANLMDLRTLNQFSGHDETLLSLRAGLDYDRGGHVVFNTAVGYESLANGRIYLRDVAGKALYATMGFTLKP